MAASGKEKFRATGTVAAPTIGIVTLVDWTQSCPNLPATQGATAYIVEIPEDFGRGGERAVITGGGVGPFPTFQLWFFDYSCSPLHDCCYESPEAIVPPGAAFLYVSTYMDAASEFELTITKTKRRA